MFAGISCRQILGYDELTVHDPGVGDAGSSDGDSGPVGCTRRSDCALGQLCVAATSVGRCVDLPTQCTLYPSALATAPAADTTEPLIVAAFVPDLTTGPFLAMNQALERINVFKLPGTRQLGVLMCSSLNEPKRTFDTLVESLQIPAIVTGFDNNLLYEAVQQHAEKTFVLNVSAANLDLVAFGNQGYLLNMLGPVEALAPTYPLLVQHAYDSLRAKLADSDAGTDAGAARKPKVDVVYDDTAINNDLGKKVLQLLQGAPIDLDSICVRQQNSGLVEQCGSNAEQARDKLVADDPDVVVALISDLNFKTTVRGFDQKKQIDCGADNDACLPLWITGPTNALDVTDYVRALDAVDGGIVTSARHRFVGVQYAGPVDRAERDDWLAKMKNALGTSTPESLYASAENYYDALFYLAYGSAAAGLGIAKADAKTFSTGINALMPGAPLQAQQTLPASDIRGAFASIAAQRELAAQTSKDPVFDLFGASGHSYEISPYNRTWRSVGGVYCVRQDEGGHYPSYDVLRYGDTDGGVAGTFTLRTEGNGEAKFCQPRTNKFEPACGFASFETYCNESGN